MPEGDAVWRAARRLHDALARRPITAWELRWGRLGASDKRGRTTLEVVPRGKHVLHRLDDGWTLHTHLRMDGRWAVGPVGRARPRGFASDPSIRVLVGTAESLATGRKLGMVDLVPTDREHELVGHLGPDLLGEDWDAEEALRRLRERPDRPLGAALLDQSNLAGIGTMWDAEICFLEKVSPWLPVGSLNDAALAAVVARAHRLLTGTLRFQGSVSTGDWRDPLYIYGKPGRPCPRCATPLTKASIGEAPEQRELYFCPRCQPVPGRD
ncbi:DNA-formamidopyrimidine glycosylase family protein [Aestuariimicrobium sp. T2.26MG-19.2B]|uniref:DNA-formamidopyrimidine glycosylase family protein n=1 Tax=Aestuariimicrobium sp. T2.26MG-19.2B TaxID=3040679 RepID=UPI002540B467|nr:DNA-formamidopyrimidine glycosylase family protein [Aestuariimicrobium sp. T2.26MG-19.2B]